MKTAPCGSSKSPISAQTIASEAELYFYSRVFGFELADPVEPVAIENL